MKEDSKTATMEIIVGSQSSVSWSKWYTEDPNERERYGIRTLVSETKNL